MEHVSWEVMTTQYTYDKLFAKFYIHEHTFSESLYSFNKEYYINLSLSLSHTHTHTYKIKNKDKKKANRTGKDLFHVFFMYL